MGCKVYQLSKLTSTYDSKARQKVSRKLNDLDLRMIAVFTFFYFELSVILFHRGYVSLQPYCSGP